MPPSPAGQRDATCRLPVSCLAFLATLACSPAGTPSNVADAPDESVTAAGGGWEILLDGSGLDRWRGFRRDDVPDAWRARDGVLAFSPIDDSAERGDIMTRDTYGDFELQLEWRVQEAGNSGIMYRVTEAERAPWLTGLEMQVLDDELHADGQVPSHRAGALYDLVVPPEDVVRPVGEWNEARIEVRGNRVRQWLNGHLTADVEIGSDDWNARLAASKFAEVPSFASAREGHIALQDHGDPVWYRDIRVRRLD